MTEASPSARDGTVPCALPICGVAMDKWPRRCKRITGHGGEHGPRNLTRIGDPGWGMLVCRVCGVHLHADEPYRQVVRFWWFPGQGGWTRAFAHEVADS